MFDFLKLVLRPASKKVNVWRVIVTYSANPENLVVKVKYCATLDSDAQEKEKMRLAASELIETGWDEKYIVRTFEQIYTLPTTLPL